MLGDKADKLITQKYPNAEIFKLDCEKKMSIGQNAVDVVVDAFTDFVDPIATFNFLKNIKKRFYLVCEESEFYIAVIEKDTIQTEKIDESIISEQFEYNGYIYVNKGLLEK